MAHPKLNITTLDFHSAEAGRFIVDIPRALSLYNRRSYRSGYVYSVDYIEYIGVAGDIVSIAKIPETYAVLGAYKLGFAVWREQRAEAIDDSGVEPGRWSDFKPFYSEEHLTGAWPELSARGMSAILELQALDVTGAEWNRAEIVVNDYAAATTTTHQIGMLGADNLVANYGSLMNAYGDTRAATLSPDPMMPADASGAWITRTGEQAAEMTGDVINLLESENDTPPYANIVDPLLPPSYVGNDQSAPRGVLVDMSVAGSTGRSVNLNGGLIPLGLLAIATAGTAFTLRVHVTRGDYKGVAAKSMGSFR